MSAGFAIMLLVLTAWGQYGSVLWSEYDGWFLLRDALRTLMILVMSHVWDCTFTAAWYYPPVMLPDVLISIRAQDHPFWLGHHAAIFAHF